MSSIERTPVRLVAAALAGALACGLVLTRTHGASAATQFHHTARSPEFFINGGQNASVSTLNVGTTTVTCKCQVRSLDNHVFDSGSRELAPGNSVLFGLDHPDTNLRVVVTSTSASRPNPCLPLIEVTDASSDDALFTISSFLVTNTAA